MSNAVCAVGSIGAWVQLTSFGFWFFSANRLFFLRDRQVEELREEATLVFRAEGVYRSR